MTEPEHEPEPETKHLLVLERMNRGAKNFEKIQKITGLERGELASILYDEFVLLERRIMKHDFFIIVHIILLRFF